MASPPGSPSSRWWNRPIKPEPEIGPNELEVETMVAGDGYRYAKPGMTVSVHYVGYLPDGRVFLAFRLNGGTPLWSAFSHDTAKTWTEPVPLKGSPGTPYAVWPQLKLHPT